MKTQRIELLAYWPWQQRGMPIGSPDADWFLAERLLSKEAGPPQPSVGKLPLFAFGIERRTR